MSEDMTYEPLVMVAVPSGELDALRGRVAELEAENARLRQCSTYLQNVVDAACAAFGKHGWHSTSLELPGDVASILRQLDARNLRIEELEGENAGLRQGCAELACALALADAENANLRAVIANISAHGGVDIDAAARRTLGRS